MAETSKDKLKVAGTMIHQGNFDKALSLVEEVLAKEPNHPEAWYYKARVFSDKNYKKISSNDKKTQEAFKSMEKMVENAPNAAYYFARKGELLTMIGGGKEIQEMIRDAYDQAYKLSPSNRSFAERLALACDQTGDHSRADEIRNSMGTYIPIQKRHPEAAPQPPQPGQPVSLPFIERLKKEYPEVKQLAIHEGDNKYRISSCLIDAFRGETPPEFYILIKGYEEGMPLIFGNSLLDKREINKKISIIKDKLKKQGYASGLVDWASDFWENVEALA
jgi:tetratricopeptide (TPR) repeat protein